MSVPIVVLGEDAAADGPLVLRHLVRAALQCLVEGLRTNELLFVEPPALLRAMALRRTWASSRHRDQVSFVQALAAEAAKGHVVVLHYDADAPWGAPSPHDEPYERLVRTRVARLSSEDRATKRIVAMVPHTAIESWTYRSLDRATQICQHVGFDPSPHHAWAADPAQLEATLAVKRESRLADQYNLDLVRSGWPREAALADGRSFARFVARLGEVPGLIDALREAG